jgi:hypothetical protein
VNRYIDDARQVNSRFAFNDVDLDPCVDFPQHLASRVIAARFGLAPHVAQLLRQLAGLGEARQ